MNGNPQIIPLFQGNLMLSLRATLHCPVIPAQLGNKHFVNWKKYPLVIQHSYEKLLIYIHLYIISRWFTYENRYFHSKESNYQRVDRLARIPWTILHPPTATESFEPLSWLLLVPAWAWKRMALRWSWLFLMMYTNIYNMGKLSDFTNLKVSAIGIVTPY